MESVASSSSSSDRRLHPTQAFPTQPLQDRIFRALHHHLRLLTDPNLTSLSWVPQARQGGLRPQWRLKKERCVQFVLMKWRRKRGWWLVVHARMLFMKTAWLGGEEVGKEGGSCVICRARWRDQSSQERYLNLAAYVSEDDTAPSGSLCSG
ncbi:hypothetical protein GH714_043654 [Hevea brasiliensis]|uniref:Uncharacterized protein n=1 Tax=Hevea brasiliensis TaxID=3981 RepID=A0A6A6K494_HEVBR|nr:hypothetical protein GH714_043654 [Hevea brasiliensis]